MSRAIFAGDDVIHLYEMGDEDRSNYEGIPYNDDTSEGRYQSYPQELKDELWNRLIHGNNRMYSIYNEREEYCGYIELLKPNSSTPEIGIEIVKEHRNKGIAKRAVYLMLCGTEAIEKKAYYIVRIIEDNMHSRHVFENLGAEFNNSNNTKYQKDINVCKALEAETTDEKLKNRMKEMIHEYEAEDKHICEYRLYPDKLKGLLSV